MMRSTPLLRKTPMRKHAPKKRAGHDKGYLTACRGEECYLKIPGVCLGQAGRETVVPCHSNQQRHGKGMGIKAANVFTVPGCMACHAALDRGTYLTKQQRAAYWDFAYTQWEGVRAQKMGITAA